MSRKAPQGPPRADSEDLGRAVGELLHDTLVAVEKSLAAAGRTLRRHTERLDGQCERLGVHERRERERLNAIEKRLSALGRGDAGEAKGEAEKPAGSPEPIVEFCKDLKRGRFSNGDSASHVEAFFADVNRKVPKGLHKQFTRRLEKFREDSEVRTRLEGRKPSRPTAEIHLRSTLRTAETVSSRMVTSGEQIPYLEEYFQIWNRVERNLKAIQKASKAAKNKSKAAIPA